MPILGVFSTKISSVVQVTLWYSYYDDYTIAKYVLGYSNTIIKYELILPSSPVSKITPKNSDVFY